MVAVGEERDGYFSVVYPLDTSVRRGGEIIIEDYSRASFPPGTKVSFAAVNESVEEETNEENLAFLTQDHEGSQRSATSGTGIS